MAVTIKKGFYIRFSLFKKRMQSHGAFVTLYNSNPCYFFGFIYLLLFFRKIANIGSRCLLYRVCRLRKKFSY